MQQIEAADSSKSIFIPGTTKEIKSYSVKSQQALHMAEISESFIPSENELFSVQLNRSEADN